MLKLVQCLFLNQKYSFIIDAKYYLSLLLLNLLKYSPALVHGDAKMDHSCLIIDSCDISSCKGAVLHLAGFTIMKNSVIRTAGNGICRYGTVWLEDDPCTFKEKEKMPKYAFTNNTFKFSKLAALNELMDTHFGFFGPGLRKLILSTLPEPRWSTMITANSSEEIYNPSISPRQL